MEIITIEIGVIFLYNIGQIVFSKCGRDKGMAFIIVDIDENFLYIADGKLRKLSKPKKKKFKHIQAVNKIDPEIQKKIENGLYLKDSDIRTALKDHIKDHEKNDIEKAGS